MNHAIILPLLLPLFCGALLLAVGLRLSLRTRRLLSLIACWAQLPLAIGLLCLALDDQVRLYALGNWQPPFGIVLMLDRLSAMMLLLSALLSGLVLLYASRGDDERGVHFHALFQFQLLGINGAFLTGDLFNLFVFFEILLIASYALLAHGGGGARLRANLHYVVLNLVGSSLFLIGVSLLYGLLGTLNMIDLGTRIAQADADIQPLLAAAGYLLLVVFGLKAAILPLYFWLPAAYGSASPPVAALFAIMTKVGLYAIVRVFGMLFGASAGPLAGLGDELLWVLALATLAAGVFGALGARDLRRLLAYLVVVSVGTLLAGIAIGSPSSLSGALYYLLHSTLVGAALFLIAGLIAEQRGEAGADLTRDAALRQPLLLGLMFFAAAIAVAGLPPFSGFLGKLMLLRSLQPGEPAAWLWSVVLVGGLGMLVALSRAGSRIFWRGGRELHAAPHADRVRLCAALALLACSPLMVLLAHPLVGYLRETVEQLQNTAVYFDLLNGGRG